MRVRNKDAAAHGAARGNAFELCLLSASPPSLSFLLPCPIVSLLLSCVDWIARWSKMRKIGGASLLLLLALLLAVAIGGFVPHPHNSRRQQHRSRTPPPLLYAGWCVARVTLRLRGDIDVGGRHVGCELVPFAALRSPQHNSRCMLCSCTPNAPPLHPNMAHNDR